MKYRYHYHGNLDVHLPLHAISAKAGDTTTTYETDVPIRHPDFVEVRKEAGTNKPTK